MQLSDRTSPEGAPAPPAAELPPLRTRWGVASGDVGGALSIVVQNTWLLYFLVNIARLSPAVAGLVFVLGRVVDAVLDPVFGDHIDRAAQRVPRLRWVRLATLPFGVTFALLWLLPLLPGPVFVYAVAGLVLHSALFTATTMPMTSLTPDLAPTYDARTVLTGWRMTAATLTTLVAFSGPPAIVLAVTGDRDLASSRGSGWVVMGVAFGVVSIVGYAVATRAIVEPPFTGRVPAARAGRRVLAGLWRVPRFRAFLVLSVVLTVAVMVGNATLPFFLESVLHLSAGEQSLALAAFFLVSVAAIAPWMALARRLGKSRALAAGCLVYVVGLLLFAGLRPTPHQLPTLALVIVLAGIGLSAVTVLPWTMLPDCAEDLEEATGERRSGLMYALNGFATKVAGSVGVFASAVVAALVHYRSGTPVQSSETQAGLTFIIGPLAASLFVVAAVLAWRSSFSRASFDDALARLARSRQAPDGAAAEATSPT